MSKPTKVDGPKPAVIDGVNPLLLASYSRLSDIEFEDLSKLAAASECQLVASNNVIYRQNEPPEGVYIVLDGAIRLEHRGPDEIVSDHELIGLYMTFGDRELLGETIRHYTATTESYSVLLKMPFSSLQEVLWCYPDLDRDWTDDLIMRQERRKLYSPADGRAWNANSIFNRSVPPSNHMEVLR